VRWIDFGFITLQGSEFAKPILILLFAFVFTRFDPKKLRTFVISLIVLIVPFGLIFSQPDLGSSVIVAGIWLSMAFVAGSSLLYLFVLLITPVVASPFIWNILKDYQKARIEIFLNPASDPLGRGYNVIQAIIAVGSGQLFGRGLGRGTQSHLNFLPEQKTDFIFATTAEELGFVGVFLLLALFGFLIYRLLRATQIITDPEGSLIVVGVAVTLLSQIFINVGMNLGILPITGITLPLVSFGGSSLVAVFILLGLAESVLVVSKKSADTIGNS
jgi:rod shape determining protein RodA